ncbi:hypothetical protein M758_11G126800 [Ceratodon purpureus]|uniref:Uncharacterized protein n=1 Tax=Ceratodon purpureus TaxID=3225 RepID=A0A8T0GH08_CERPU|nr:hypothetical protein KC19_11G131200 [Ceratodon purpureus]KAG0601624.1 hypothetical protein M758_11G126800 [Ceratodon purpureus]
MCFGRDGAGGDESDSWKSGGGKRGSEDGGFYSLHHNNCLSNAAKNTISFVKHQRGKLYIVRRCVTMLLWDK